LANPIACAVGPTEADGEPEAFGGSVPEPLPDEGDERGVDVGRDGGELGPGGVVPAWLIVTPPPERAESKTSAAMPTPIRTIAAPLKPATTRRVGSIDSQLRLPRLRAV
jgi:hypothetical protein